jgi:hypothetical protein
VRALVLFLALGGSLPVATRAEQTILERDPERNRALVVAGSRYADVSWLHRVLFGEDYRDLWALPFRVELLDLDRFAGGLAPVRRVGQTQSRGLALRGADGRSYTFREIEKDATAGLEPDLRRSVAGRIAQDQVAALHPSAAPVTAPLLDAAGVLHTAAHLVLMPDDPALGPFRSDFAGVLGTIQEYPVPASEGQPGFAGATEIIGGEEMLARVRARVEERVDSRAFLRARLMDLFLGDWDRHLGQWRWARIPGRARWQPIPEDRDFALSRFEGLVLVVARNWRPRWVAFGEEYPDLLGLTWQAWPLDRLLLSDLEKPDWDEVAADLQRRLADEVIDAAVRRLPEEYRRADGPRLTNALRHRRDGLVEAANRFYRLLSEEVRVEATDEAEAAEAIGLDGGDLEVRLFRAGAWGEPAGEPWFRRRFRRGETREVRLVLRAGDDRLVTRGGSDIRVRVAGGEGDDLLDDSAGGATSFADWQGRNRVVPGSATRVDPRPYTPPVENPERPWIPPRDWGRERTWLPWFAADPELGAFVGGGVRLRRFAFRTHPYGSSHTLRAGYATEPRAFRVDYDGVLRLENSGVFVTFAGLASQIEILRFFGFGNDSSSDGPESFFRVDRRQLSLTSRVHVPLAPRVMLSFGASVARATTELDRDRFVSRERPYGSEPFGQLGAVAEVGFDSRDSEVAPSRGLLLAAGGSFHPAVWDVAEGFGELHGEAASYLTGALPFRPTLALRAGLKHVFGKYPFHEATFVGGPWTVRGFSNQRFAGDGGAWGNAELRLWLGRYFLVLPGEYGVFALADTGRVWLDGERSDTWHSGVGGGLWFAYVERSNTVTIAVARGAEGVGLYVRTGFLF